MHRKRTKRPLLVIAAIAAATSLSGCVLVVDGDDDDRHARRHYVEPHPSTAVHRVEDRRVRVDYGLAGELEQALRADPLLADSSITVVARGDEVTLHGRVVDLAAFDRAVEIATSTPGVTRVVSKLIVEISNGE